MKAPRQIDKQFVGFNHHLLEAAPVLKGGGGGGGEEGKGGRRGRRRRGGGEKRGGGRGGGLNFFCPLSFLMGKPFFFLFLPFFPSSLLLVSTFRLDLLFGVVAWRVAAAAAAAATGNNKKGFFFPGWLI